MKNILITGYSGFVGSRLLHEIYGDFNISLLGRKFSTYNCKHLKASIEENSDFSSILDNIDVVIHLAGRAFNLSHASSNSLQHFRAINVRGTLNLAQQAAAAGVKRFIFISTIKVNGESTCHCNAFTPDDVPAPEDVYGISKWEAEKNLHRIAEESGMDVVIIRPALVYGPGVKGNFLSLIKLVQSGIPLPFSVIRNQRSLIALDNLVDLIVTCIKHPAAANHVFLASDGHDLSISELLRGLGLAAGKPVRLFPFPGSLLMLAAALIGKKDLAQRLLGSLQVDISKARHLLGWEPPISVEEGLRRCFVED